MSQRNGMISSMTKRSWGPDEAGFAEVEIDLDSPPKAKIARTTSVLKPTASASASLKPKAFKPPAIHSTKTTSSASANGTSRYAPAPSTKPSSTPLHPMFGPKTTSTSSSASKGAPVVKKRALPWENIGAGVKAVKEKASNYHNVGGSKSGSSKSMLTSNSMNIKQKVILSPEQQMVLKLVVDDGKNVFFTGSAG